MDMHLASQIIRRARSVADLPNTAHISHEDEIRSLNESWRDVYAALKDSDDDYYVTRVELTIGAANAISGVDRQWLVDLPSDCAQVRSLSYEVQSGVWEPVNKFNPTTRNPGEWHYRLEGQKLWIIGGGETTGTLLLRYYPPAADITIPQQPYYYGSSYTPPLRRALTAPGWASYNRTMIYVGASNGIKAESQTLSTVSTPVALFTESGVPTNIIYYQGTLFWLRGGGIWSKDVDLTTAFTGPTAVESTATGVVAFFITGSTIYYATATEIYTCTLAGASDTLVSAIAATSLCVADGVVYYVASGALKSVSPAATLVASGVSKVTTDGTYLYVLNTDYTIDRLTVSATPAVTATDQLLTDVLDMGHAAYDTSNEVSAIGQLSVAAPPVWVLPVTTRETQKVMAMDVTVDHDFTYPNNLVPEIMAHQCAIDFRTKGEKNAAGIAQRLEALWNRFRSSIKRDEYQPVRIGNHYAARGIW